MIHELRNEIEQIQNDVVRSFAVEALQLLSHDQEDVGYIKKVVEYLLELSEVIDADDLAKDFIVVSGLLHEIGENTMDARIRLTPLMSIIGRENFNNILYLIERQDGFSSPYPEYTPQIDSPVHIWILPMAIKLAKGG